MGRVICALRESVNCRWQRKAYTWDVCMLIEILRADLAAALLSAFRSNHDFECRLNMRRIRIIQYEGLSRISEMLGKLKGVESVRQEIRDILKILDAQLRHAAVHYRFGEKDYIPIAYKDSISANMTIRNLIDVVPFLNQLNRVATWLK